MAQVDDDRQRARTAVERAEHERERLRGELAAVRADTDLMQRERGETADALAQALSRAGDALARLRAPMAGSAGPVVSSPEAGRLPAAEPAVVPRAPAALMPPAPAGPPAHAHAPARPPVAAPRMDTAMPKRILLVDDDTNFRNVIIEYLSGFRGYDVQAAVSGEEPLSLLGDDRPDMVLLDLMMPGIGGMGALQRIKAQYPDLPVVMVTANEDLSIACKALALGAADYVTKPFDLDYLDAVLNIYLNKTDPHDEPEPARAHRSRGHRPRPPARSGRTSRVADERRRARGRRPGVR